MKPLLPFMMIVSLLLASCAPATQEVTPTPSMTATPLPSPTASATLTPTPTPVPQPLQNLMEQSAQLEIAGYVIVSTENATALMDTDANGKETEVVRFSADGSLVIYGLDTAFKAIMVERSWGSVTDNSAETEFSAAAAKDFKLTTEPVAGGTSTNIFIEVKNSDGEFVRVARYADAENAWQERYDVTVGAKTYEGWLTERTTKDITEGEPIRPPFLKRVNRSPEFGDTSFSTDLGYVDKKEVIELDNGELGEAREAVKIVFARIKYFLTGGGSFSIEGSGLYDSDITGEFSVGDHNNPSFMTPDSGNFTDKLRETAVSLNDLSDFEELLLIGDGSSPFITSAQLEKALRSLKNGDYLDLRFIAIPMFYPRT